MDFKRTTDIQVVQNTNRITLDDQIIDLFLYIFESIIIGGIGITFEIDFSQFFCWNKGCPDYGIKNQGNIVLKERYGKKQPCAS